MIIRSIELSIPCSFPPETCHLKLYHFTSSQTYAKWKFLSDRRFLQIYIFYQCTVCTLFYHSLNSLYLLFLQFSNHFLNVFFQVWTGHDHIWRGKHSILHYQIPTICKCSTHIIVLNDVSKIETLEDLLNSCRSCLKWMVQQI